MEDIYITKDEQDINLEEHGWKKRKQELHMLGQNPPGQIRLKMLQLKFLYQLLRPYICSGNFWLDLKYLFFNRSMLGNFLFFLHGVNNSNSLQHIYRMPTNSSNMCYPRSWWSSDFLVWYASIVIAFMVCF